MECRNPIKGHVKHRLLDYIKGHGVHLYGMKQKDIFLALIDAGGIDKSYYGQGKKGRVELMLILYKKMSVNGKSWRKSFVPASENWKPSWAKSKAKPKKHNKEKYAIASKKFFASREWKELRYKVLSRYGRICMLCGDRPPNCVIHVDHIKPRIKYPHLELDEDNLQVLCGDCNEGKSYKYQDDFREMQEMNDRLKWVTENSA